ncbi:MAG: tetratricopeptide repeat protein [Planctomycetota bacterium]
MARRSDSIDHAGYRTARAGCAKVKILVALCFPLAVFALIELALRMAGVARPETFFVVGTRPDGEPVLEVNPRSPWGELPFRPPSFTQRKPEGSCRIFCLGDSTVNGTPFHRHCSFSAWLQVRLEHLHPGKRFEVVRMGYDSKPAREIAKLCEEVVHYEPDLVIVYTGHNEFIVQNLATVRHAWGTRIREWLSSFRLGTVLYALGPLPVERPEHLVKNPVRRITDTPFLSPAEIDQGYEYYREGLERMVRACHEAGVRLMLCYPVCNLRDYEPVRSTLATSLPEAERARFRQLYEEGEQLLRAGRFERALQAYDGALAIDASPALLHYRRGRCLDRLGRFGEARAAYEQARDSDNHPNRATSRHWRLIDECAGPEELIADCGSVFDAAARDGIPGEDLFVDNCHPDIDNQNLIAEAVLRAMADAGLVAPRAEWHIGEEPDLAEYHRRMGLDLRKVATDLAGYVLYNLLYVLGNEASVDPVREAEDVLLFSRRYDATNPTALLGLALVSTLQGNLEEARRYAQQSRERDPTVIGTVLKLARDSKNPRVNELLQRVPGLLAPEGEAAGGAPARNE